MSYDDFLEPSKQNTKIIDINANKYLESFFMTLKIKQKKFSKILM
ncbi:hypothetical protein EV145_11638 [Flavobacterium sp. 245]|nr:hypothetical protein EV145_11638 [Flavobacterium sp. 245]